MRCNSCGQSSRPLWLWIAGAAGIALVSAMLQGLRLDVKREGPREVKVKADMHTNADMLEKTPAPDWPDAAAEGGNEAWQERAVSTVATAETYPNDCILSEEDRVWKNCPYLAQKQGGML